MKYLLDTHALLWWMSGNERLKLATREVITSPSTTILVSIGSIWEILIKVRAGRLEANLTEIEQTIEEDGFERLPIKTAHLEVLASLPRHHRDPFDHLLIAQAVSEDATLISDDRVIRQYPVRVLSRGQI